ncbi:unnamed protein product [Caenorhabditis sp. 36 PRJEB53466]|nr:unnamed protein product [Caenorhabditis sp. 36 PRJEB53466]
MKLLFFACLLGIFLPVLLEEGVSEKVELFNFHVKTVKKFNKARRIIASGSLVPLMKIVNKGRSFVGASKIEVGPASNMYKLRWSREMEQVALKLFHEIQDELKSRSMTAVLHMNVRQVEGYRAFIWMGPIIELAKTILSIIPASIIESLGKILELIETIIIVVWMAICYPKESPVNHGMVHCAAEALFATRYEIGCFTNVFGGVCVVRHTRDEELFKVGVACNECPVGSHCEYTLNKDGYYEEGDLCTPPDPNGTMALSKPGVTTIKPKGSMDNSAGNPNFSIYLLVILSFFLFY